MKKTIRIINMLLLLIIIALCIFTLNLSDKLEEKRLESKASQTETKETIPPTINQESNIYSEVKSIMDLNCVYSSNYEGEDIDDLLDSYQDPYAKYISSDEYNAQLSALEGNTQSIGISIQKKDNKFIIASVLQDSPAYKAGLRKNMNIYAINDFSISDNVTNKQIKEYLLENTEKKYTTITILKNGEKQNFKIKKINLADFKLYLKDKILTVKISRFSDKSISNIISYINDNQDKIAYIKFDLRDNQGGSVQAGINLADILIPKGETIVIFEYNSKNQTVVSTNDMIDIPFELIINENTASASEIVVAAVNANKSGKIIGHKTYGKGVIQQYFKLSNGDYIKCSIAKWFDKNGTSIDDISLNSLE